MVNGWTTTCTASVFISGQIEVSTKETTFTTKDTVKEYTRQKITSSMMGNEKKDFSMEKFK